MKHVNKTVMGALMGALLMAFGSNSFGALLISEEFDAVPGTNFTFNNFDAGIADFITSQDTTGVLSGPNSAKVAVTSPGSDWWAIQVRSSANLLGGTTMTFSFDIKSSAALGFDVVVEGDTNGQQFFPVSLAAGETKHYEFTTAVLVNQEPARLIFGLGNASAGSQIWIDNVQVAGDPSPSTEVPFVEEFDDAPAGENFGRFLMKNYGAGASYTFNQDTNSVLSGTNSARFNIANAGTDWWAIQLRMENLIIKANSIIAVSFDIKSTADLSFNSVIESLAGQAPHSEPVTVLAGETKTVKYQTDLITNATSTATFILGLGNSAVGAAEVWLDNVELRYWAPLSEIGDITVTDVLGTNGLVLTWSTDVGYDYALETKSNLPIGNWTTNQIVPGVGGNVSVTTAVDQAQSFYRVTAEQ